MQRILHPHAGERGAGAAVGLSEAPSVLRRAKATARTAAGEYIADPYETNSVKGAGGITTGYGAKIKITFKANDNVDAEKIALVQTVRSVMDGRVHNVYDRRERDTAESKEKKKSKREESEAEKKERLVNASRMIRSGPTKAGTHIDQLPRVRTPLYGVPEHRGDALSQPEPSTISTIGCHYKDSQGRLVQNQDASLFDTPDLNSGDIYTEASKVMKKGWSQTFETSALAIEGRQKGTYYGSVTWGWWRTVDDTDATGTHLAFSTKSDTVPSPVFQEAAQLWNASKTTEDKETIDLPAAQPDNVKTKGP